MRLVELRLENFRAYRAATSIAFEALTVLVGRNDAGKSSLLDALNIFFNDSPIENADCSVDGGASDIRITCIFDDLPTEVVIDDQFPTSLDAEHLLRADGRLEIRKTFNCGPAKGKCTGVAAFAHHPSTAGLNDLLGLKIAELRTRAIQRGVNLGGVNEAIKAQLRRAIWDQAGHLELQEREISLLKESGKELWEQLQRHMPLYAVFKSDRASTDQDEEAQDPLKAAIKEAIRGRESELTRVLGDIDRELRRVADATVKKIKDMSPELANQLTPTVKNKNWESLFSVSLTGDDQVPINKRGSGTRRLVLMNFFRAKAEDDSTSRGCGVIYAIEEPETSQHPNHQIMLLEALEEMAEQRFCQVIVTTHTPTLARRVSRTALRLIDRHQAHPIVRSGIEDATLSDIKKTLGVLPDHDVKAFFGVEGKHDVHFLRRISAILSLSEPDIPNLEIEERAGRLVFMSLGGSNMDNWLNTVQQFERPEFYLTDRDVPPPAPPKYQALLTHWQARGCTAWSTSKKELENYLHPDAIRAMVPSYTGLGQDFEDVPSLLAEARHNANPGLPPWSAISPDQKDRKCSGAKKMLNTTCVEAMTAARLTQIDPGDEVRIWLRAVGRALGA